MSKEANQLQPAMYNYGYIPASLSCYFVHKCGVHVEKDLGVPMLYYTPTLFLLPTRYLLEVQRMLQPMSSHPEHSLHIYCIVSLEI